MAGDEKEDSGKRKFYDVESYAGFLEKQRGHSAPRGLSLVIQRFRSILDSVQGFLFALAGIPIFFGAILISFVAGAFYGPLAFLALAGGSIAALTLLVERKVGASLVFGNYSVLKRALAQTIAFALLLGTILLLVHVTRIF